MYDNDNTTPELDLLFQPPMVISYIITVRTMQRLHYFESTRVPKSFSSLEFCSPDI